jgi:hypothetical protein
MLRPAIIGIARSGCVARFSSRNTNPRRHMMLVNAIFICLSLSLFVCGGADVLILILLRA